jgi:hypothetical protein
MATVLQLNVDYELLWRGLATVLFRNHTGLSVGYGFRGQVDDSNAAEVVAKHPTPEHVAQLALARFLRASMLGIGRHGSQLPAFLRRLCAWYGGMACHTYGASTKHYVRNKKALKALAEEAEALLHVPLREDVTEEAEDQAEDAFLRVPASELGEKVTAFMMNLRCTFQDVERIRLKDKRRSRHAGRYDGDPVDPPPLDSVFDTRKPVPHVVLTPEQLSEFAPESDDGVTVLCSSRPTEQDGDADVFAFVVREAAEPWFEKPGAKDVIRGALNAGIHPSTVASVFSLANWVVQYVIEQPPKEGEPEPDEPTHPEPVGPTHPEPDEPTHPEPDEQPHPEPVGPTHPETDEQPHPEPDEQPHPEPDEQTHPERGTRSASPLDSAADQLSGDAPGAAVVGPLEPELWVIAGSNPESHRAVDRALRKAGKLAKQTQRRRDTSSGALLPPLCELLELPDDLLLCVLLAPDSRMRDATWSLLAEVSQEALHGPGLLRLRAALGLLQSGVSDDELSEQKGRRGVLELGAAETHVWVPYPSRTMADLVEALVDFESRHELLKGAFVVCLSRKQSGYRAAPLAQDDGRALDCLRVYRSERATISGTERMDPARCVILDETAGKATLSSGEFKGMRRRRPRPHRRGIGFADESVWQRVLQKGSANPAMERLLDVADEATEGLRGAFLEDAE